MENWWLISISAAALGFIIGYLVSGQLKQKKLSAVKDELNEAAIALNEEKVRREAALQAGQKDTEAFRLQLQSLQESLNTLRSENSNLQAGKTRLETLNESLKEQIQEKLEDLHKQEERLRNEFKALANEILKKNSIELSDTNRQQLGHLLNPLKEQIERFEKKVQESHEAGSKRHTQLEVELEKLRELNTGLQQEAGNLTRALKGDTKKQGDWGEFVLERVLEVSGLEKGREYHVQQSFKSGTGIARPDVIVSLPEGKHLAIDSKVSLKSYEAYVSAATEDERSAALKLHLTSVRNHVKQLSEKKYHQVEGLDTPDFVLLFMPVEPAFSLAMREDPDLFNLAWDKRIVIVSPTTLLATLRTVASIWKHEKQTQNALEIAKAGGALFDKFAGFATDMEQIGQRIRQLQKAYEDADNKLSTGHGNLVKRVTRLRELGAKASRELPEKYKAVENGLDDGDEKE